MNSILELIAPAYFKNEQEARELRDKVAEQRQKVKETFESYGRREVVSD